jgi:hypothetical protein
MAWRGRPEARATPEPTQEAPVSDIFDEVEEEVRKERWEQLWKKYGNYAVALGVVVVLGVGGYRGWQAYQHHLNEQSSDAYLAAGVLAENGNLVGAESAFAKLAADAPSGYATLAKFAQAAVMLTENKREAALVLLRELADDDDPILANVARLQTGWVEADFAPKSEIQALLAPLLAADSPWRFAAGEVVAYTDLRLGARGEALAAYLKLAKEPAAPQGIRQRAAAIAEYLQANPGVTTLPNFTAPPVLPSAPRPTVPSPPVPAPAPAAAPALEAHP